MRFPTTERSRVAAEPANQGLEALSPTSVQPLTHDQLVSAAQQIADELDRLQKEDQKETEKQKEADKQNGADKKGDSGGKSDADRSQESGVPGGMWNSR